jgi:hypothetical protein
MRKGLIPAIIHVVTLCVLVFAISAYFVYDADRIGYVLMALGLLCLWSVRLYGVSVASLSPDIVFGVIDNGVLAVMAVFGGRIAGVPGAVIGGVVGNALTDGIAGIFEGYWAESLISDKRTVLGSAVGKMAGCLLGAGAVLIVLGHL